MPWDKDPVVASAPAGWAKDPVVGAAPQVDTKAMPLPSPMYPLDMAPEEGRRALELGRIYDTSTMSTDGAKQFKVQLAQQQFASKLKALPRIAAFAAQSDAHASVMQKEVDTFHPVEYFFGRTFTVGGEVNEGVLEKGGEVHYTPPGWLLAIGRSADEFLGGAKLWALKNYGYKEGNYQRWKEGRGTLLGYDPSEEQIAEATKSAGVKVPGDEDPILRHVNNLAGAVPLIGAAMVHPALAFGYMHVETTGRSYASLRQGGYDHDTASSMSELIGFTSASIGAAMGPMFKFSPLTAEARRLMMGVPDAITESVVKNPTLWRAAWGLSKNVVANTAMNIAQASSEANYRETLDAAREGRPYNVSRAVGAARDAAKSWEEVLALSVIPAYKEHQNRRLLYAGQQFAEGAAVERSKEEIRAQGLVDEWEERGLGVRSMVAGHKLLAAVRGVQGSDLAKEQPEVARQLVRALVAPTKKQSVYINAEMLARLDPDSLSLLGTIDTSGAGAGKARVGLVDYLLHPQAEEMISGVSPEADLMEVGKAKKIDLTGKLGEKRVADADAKAAEGGLLTRDEFEIYKATVNQQVAEEGRFERDAQDKYDEIATKTTSEEDELFQARLRRHMADTEAARDEMRARHSDEIDKLTDGDMMRAVVGEMAARFDSYEAYRAATAAANAPNPGRAKVIPMSVASLATWAKDHVSRQPTGELRDLAEQQTAAAAERRREGIAARTKATEQAKLGQPADEHEDVAQEMERRDKQSSALAEAARRGAEEAEKISGDLAALTRDEKNKQGRTPREVAWAAGEEFGSSFDALAESMGLAERRGYAAPDLSDVIHKMAAERKLTADKFDGWDKELVDQLLKTAHAPRELTLAELREVHKAMSQIALAADAENNVYRDGVTVAKGIIKNEIVEHLKNVEPVSEGRRISGANKDALPALDRAKARAASVAATLAQPHVVLGKLGRNGDWLYYERFVPGRSREERMWGDKQQRIHEAEQSVPREVKESGSDKIDGPNGDPWLRHQVWDLALKLGVQGEDTRIASGLGFSPDQKKGISAESKLHAWVQANIARSSEHAQIVMEKLVAPHWKMFGELWDEYTQHFKDRRLAPPKQLRGTTLSIGGKEYEGSYGGRQQYVDLQQRAVAHPGSLESLLDDGFSGPSVDSRHLIERSEFQGVPRFDWNSVAGSMQKEIHDIAMRPFVEDMHKIFSDGDLRRTIADKLGKETLNQIFDPSRDDSFLHVVARGGVQHNTDPISKLVLNVAGRAAYSAFALNFRVMGGQMSHLLATMPAMGIGPQHMAVGLRDAFSTDGRETATARFDAVSLRYTDYQARSVEMERQLSGFSPGGTAVHRATDAANWAAWREMDHFLSTAIAGAAYHKAISENMTHDAAVLEGNKAVAKMMPPMDVYDQPAFVRNRTVAGIFYMVKNFPLTLLNVTAANWWDAKVGGGGAAQKGLAVAKYVGMVMAVGAVGEAWLMRGGAPEDKDKGQWWLEHTAGSLFYPFMLREPVMAAYHAARGESREARQELERLTPAALQLIMQSYDDVSKAVGDGDEEAAHRAAAHLLGVATKSPLPMKAYDLYNAASNGEDPLDALKKGMGYRQ